MSPIPIILAAVVMLTACGLNDKPKNMSDEQRLLKLVQENKAAQVKQLVLAGVSPNGVDELGRSALEIAAYRKNEALLSWLIEHGAKDVGEGGVLAAATFRRSPDMVRLLIKAGFDVNRHESRSDTPLMRAAVKGDEEIVRMLLDGGANINEKSMNYNKTALMNAMLQITLIHKKDRAGPSLIKLLLNHGADVNALDDSGQSALFYVSGDSFNPVDAWMIEAARLLIEAGADVNIRSTEGMTPLLAAAQSNNYELVKLLLEHGADARVKDNKGWTSLMSAAGHANTEMVRAFLREGVDVNARVSHLGDDSWTALKAAKSYGTPEIVEMLKQAGAMR